MVVKQRRFYRADRRGLVGAAALQKLYKTSQEQQKSYFFRHHLISYITTGLFLFLSLAATRQDVVKPPRSRFGLRVLSPLCHRERGDQPSFGLAALPGCPHPGERLPHGCSARGPRQVSPACSRRCGRGGRRRAVINCRAVRLFLESLGFAGRTLLCKWVE